MQSKLIGTWLLSTSIGVFGLITLGGYTRLKRAGLSMVDWKPLNVRYPQTQEEWAFEFKRYQEFPEYKTSNCDLEEFKEIYFIEYAHRVLARSMGLYLAVPMGIFWWTGRFTPSFKPKMLALLGFFGFQGILGWWMVKSGLEDKDYDHRVKVEPVRLTTHLGFGAGLFAYISYLGFSCFRKSPEEVFNTAEKLNSALKIRKWLIGSLAMTGITILAGALVAGSDAGRVLNNYPWYGEDWVYPKDFLEKQPWYTNFYENRSMVQFVHRNLAYLTYAKLFLTWRTARLLPLLPPSVRFGINGIFLLSNLQALLGITTLMRGCPLPESLSHQGNALLLMAMILFSLSGVKKPPQELITKLLKPA